MIDRRIGRRVKLRRRALGMTQKTLGAALGVSFQQIQKYERGANRLPASSLVQIGAALGCPASALLGDVVSAKPVDADLMEILRDENAAALLRAFAEIGARDVRKAVRLTVEALAAGASCDGR
jgi:transcriptional regulator with XRE-family HTH domain